MRVFMRVCMFKGIFNENNGFSYQIHVCYDIIGGIFKAMLFFIMFEVDLPSSYVTFLALAMVE